MRSDHQTLGFGLVIGVALGASVLLLAFFLSSVAPQTTRVDSLPTATVANATATSQPVPTTTPTFTPIAPWTVPTNIVAISVISPTPDPVLLTIARGDLVFSGPLSAAKQVALYRASLTYAQTTVADSKRVSKEINGVGYGDPTNICGPLAIAILRDAQVIPSYIDPHDYWLLDPSKVPDERLIETAFPASEFTHEVIKTPLNKVDWSATPLRPGDFLFIWHGSWGNFDHMLVVNRVDSQGRAYAVTNFGTPDGYLIAETMLYDPNDRQAGIFHTWTKERDALLGSTGFGGFEVWRFNSE